MSKKKSDYSGLSNEEIIMIYYRFDKYLKGLNENLDNNRVTKSIQTPLGSGLQIISVPQEHVDKFKKTQYYNLVTSIVDKLKPIVDLIEECDPSLKELAETVK